MLQYRKVYYFILLNLLIHIIYYFIPANNWTNLGLAVAQAETVNNPTDEITNLYQRGNLEIEQGNFEKAIKFFEQVLKRSREINNQNLEWLSLTQLGRIYRIKGQYSQSLELLNQALDITVKLRDKEGTGTVFYNIGQVQELLGQYQNALNYYQQALIIAKNIANKSIEGSTLQNLGQIYQRLGQYQKAIEHFEQGLRLYQELDNKIIQSRIISNLGTVYISLAQYPKALTYFQEALTISQQENDEAGTANIFYSLGVINLSQSQYKLAEQYLNQALKLSEKIQDKNIEGAALSALAEVYITEGNVKQALLYFEKSLDLYKSIGNQEKIIYLYLSFGQFYSLKSEFPEALKYLEKALAMQQVIGDRLIKATILNSLGKIYFNIGRGTYQKSYNFFNEALMISQEIGDRAAEGTVINNIGRIYQKQGNSKKALEYFNQSLAINIEIGNRKNQLANLFNIGQIYYELKQYNQAKSFYQQALMINQEINNPQSFSIIYNDLALVELANNQYSQALEYLKKSLEYSTNLNDKIEQRVILHNLGLTYSLLQNYADAEKYLFQAVEIQEQLRPGLIDQYQVSIFDEQKGIYELLQNALIKQGKFNTALEIAERSRARTYAELLASRILDIPSTDLNIPSPKLEQIKQIAQQQQATIVEYSLGINQIYIWVIQPTGKIEFQAIDSSSLNTSLANLIQETRESIGVRNRGESELIAFAIGDLIKLKDDAADYEPWEVVAVDKIAKILTLRQSSFPQGVVIKKTIAEVAAKVQSRRSNNLYFQKLYQQLIEPIAHLLPNDPNANIIFIPQNELFLIPYAALQDSQGKYLIEKHTIRVAPSIGILQYTKQQKKDNNIFSPALIVGNPTMPIIKESEQPLASLPEAEKEAQQIAQLLNTKPLIGKEATKTAIIEKMPTANLIHLATHGLLDENAIALAADNSLGANNGLLTDQEIRQMKLQANLAVLSACNTGQGKITGDGVIGLSRALITAGVPSVIVSLWAVPDAPTANLMTAFYQNLQNTPSKAQALRQAMLATLEQHPNPKDWAGFILIGE